MLLHSSLSLLSSSLTDLAHFLHTNVQCHRDQNCPCAPTSACPEDLLLLHGFRHLNGFTILSRVLSAHATYHEDANAPISCAADHADDHNEEYEDDKDEEEDTGLDQQTQSQTQDEAPVVVVSDRHMIATAFMILQLVCAPCHINVDFLVAENLVMPLIDVLSWSILTPDRHLILSWAFPTLALCLSYTPHMECIRLDLIRYDIDTSTT